MKSVKKVTLRSLVHIAICIIAFTITTFCGFQKKLYIPATIALFFSIFFIRGFVILYKEYKLHTK